MSVATQPRMRSGGPVPESDELWIKSILDVAYAQLFYSDGTVTRSPLVLADYMVWIARKAYDRGYLDAKLQVLTSDEAAALLGVDRSTVWRRAQRKGVGWMVGRDLLLWPEDLEKLRLA